MQPVILSAAELITRSHPYHTELTFFIVEKTQYNFARTPIAAKFD